MAVLRSPGRPAKAALAVVLILGTVVEGCAWVRWRSLALTHVDLMERLALDGAESLAAPGRGLEPGDIERLRYPLERARAFSRSSHGRFGDEAVWLGKFDALLGAYAELVDFLDKARTRRIGERAKEEARSLARAVEVAAEDARRELGGNGAATSSLSPNPPGTFAARCRSAGA